MEKWISLTPQCFICREFKYYKDSEKLYCCSAIEFNTNDIYELWDECPYLHMKFLVVEDDE